MLPPYTSIRPEERLCRVTPAVYHALERAYDTLEERILMRSLRSSIPESLREPTKQEAQDLARFEALFRSIYFDKERSRTELASPLNRALAKTVESLLGSLPSYTVAI